VLLAAGNGASVRVRGFAGGWPASLSAPVSASRRSQARQDRVRLAVLKIDPPARTVTSCPTQLSKSVSMSRIRLPTLVALSENRMPLSNVTTSFGRISVFLGDEFDPLVQRRACL
jgi:hypothetical protein